MSRSSRFFFICGCTATRTTHHCTHFGWAQHKFGTICEGGNYCVRQIKVAEIFAKKSFNESNVSERYPCGESIICVNFLKNWIAARAWEIVCRKHNVEREINLVSSLKGSVLKIQREYRLWFTVMILSRTRQWKIIKIIVVWFCDEKL